MTNQLTDRDRDALTRALALAHTESRARSHQLDAMLAEGRPWEKVAGFAAYSQQVARLKLQPWEFPPVWITDIDAALNVRDDARHIPGSARLLQKMLAHGISRFEPDPLAALERAGLR